MHHQSADQQHLFTAFFAIVFSVLVAPSALVRFRPLSPVLRAHLGPFRANAHWRWSALMLLKWELVILTASYSCLATQCFPMLSIFHHLSNVVVFPMVFPMVFPSRNSHPYAVSVCCVGSFLCSVRVTSAKDQSARDHQKAGHRAQSSLACGILRVRRVPTFFKALANATSSVKFHKATWGAVGRPTEPSLVFSRYATQFSQLWCSQALVMSLLTMLQHDEPCFKLLKHA